MKYNVQYVAVYNVTALVDAESEDEAVRMVRAQEWEDLLDEEYDRPHPETEYFVEEDPFDD